MCLCRQAMPIVAKAYILYRKQREKVRNTSTTLLDYKKLVNGYVKIDDWRVKENSTVTYSVGGLILSNSGAITANYWLSEVYDEEVANAHRRRRYAHPRPEHAHGLLRGLVAQAADSGRTGRHPRQKSPPHPPAICPRCATKWSTFWASCKTSGPVRRQCLLLIPI